MIRVIELFAGIGSQREALKRANIEHEIVAISENDKYVSRAYELLHGLTNNLGDIRKIKRLPKADLWTYSFPCTGISLAVKMKGFEKGSNTHSSLLWEVQRLLKVAKENDELPKFLLMENVKNILSKKFMSLFQVWIDYLDSLGYKNFFKVLNSKDYGIPQNRERCIMVSIRDKNARFEFPIPIPLTKKLADLLENDADEKYFLSEKLITCFTDMSDRHGLICGLKFRPKYMNETDYAFVITTHAGYRPTDNYIIVPQATKAGYALAEVGDGVYTNRCQYKRGVVQRSMIPTIKTSVRKVQKDCLISFENCKYSFPSNYVERNVVVAKVGSILNIYYNSEKIASHQISSEKNKIIIDPNHYKTILENSDYNEVNTLIDENLVLHNINLGEYNIWIRW